MLSVEFKGEKGRFVALNPFELRDSLSSLNNWALSSDISNMSHTKAAARVGGGHKSIFTLRQTVPITLKSGDVVFPQIIIRDRSFPGGALTVHFGLYRLVCSNGLMAFRSVAAPVRIPHYRNRAQVLMELTRVIQSSGDRFAAIVEEAERLDGLTVVDPELAIMAMTLPMSTKKRAIETIGAGLVRPEDDIKTAWGLYNFVNELDRVKARRGSTAYLDRDLNTIPAPTAA